MDKMTLTRHLRACAEAAKSFSNGLVAQLAEAVTEALEEMNAVKADKSHSVLVMLPPEGWDFDESDLVEGYPVYYDIPVQGVTAKDRATVSIAPAAMQAAIDCGMCPTSETVAGAIRIRAMNAPAEAIPVEYWLDQGKE